MLKKLSYNSAMISELRRRLQILDERIQIYNYGRGLLEERDILLNAADPTSRTRAECQLSWHYIDLLYITPKDILAEEVRKQDEHYTRGKNRVRAAAEGFLIRQVIPRIHGENGLRYVLENLTKLPDGLPNVRTRAESAVRIMTVLERY